LSPRVYSCKVLCTYSQSSCAWWFEGYRWFNCKDPKYGEVFEGIPSKIGQLKSCTERKRIWSNASLTLDVPTRWNSTYIMLEVVEKYERTFDLMLDEDSNFVNYLCEDGGGKRGLGPSIDDDWNNVRHFTNFLQVFYGVTVQILGSLYSTSNMYFSIFQKVCNCLTDRVYW